MIDTLQTLNLNVSSWSQPTSVSAHSEMMNAAVKQVDEPGQSSFSQVLAESGEQFVSTINKAEELAVAGITGKASVYEVATGMMEAEQQLRMATAIRDRVVQAFLEVSRMQI